MLAFVVGLKAEASLLQGHIFVGGGAPHAAARAVKAGASAMVSFGLAGGLDPSMRPGTLVTPNHVVQHGRSYPTDLALARALGDLPCDAVLAADSIAADAASKAHLWRETGAQIVDLESGAVGAKPHWRQAFHSPCCAPCATRRNARCRP